MNYDASVSPLILKGLDSGGAKRLGGGPTVRREGALQEHSSQSVQCASVILIHTPRSSGYSAWPDHRRTWLGLIVVDRVSGSLSLQACPAGPHKPGLIFVYTQ